MQRFPSCHGSGKTSAQVVEFTRVVPAWWSVHRIEYPSAVISIDMVMSSRRFECRRGLHEYEPGSAIAIMNPASVIAIV